MNLLRLLDTIATPERAPLRRLIVGAAATALCTTVVLAVVMTAAEEVARTEEEYVDLPTAALFVVSVLLYMLFQSMVVAWLAADMEAAIDGMRMRLIGRLRHADLWRLEHFGRSRLYESITQSCRVISSNSQYLVLGTCSVFLIVAILLYIAIVSAVAFLLLVALMAGAAFIYYRKNLLLEVLQEGLAEHEAKLFESVSDLFDGFKEQRLNSARSRALNQTFARLSAETATERGQVHRYRWQQFVFGETAFNLMLGLVVFVVPAYASSVEEDLVKTSAAVLFLIAPVFGLMQSLAVLRAAESAAGRMMALEGELAPLVERGSEEEPEPVPTDFAELRMEGVEFAYPAPAGEQPFKLGPLDVAVRRGETLFITGGNGSGKSTFIKLLTGLYHPERGRLTCDTLEIGPEDLAGYRALMAPVFSDFHLFERFYGIGKIDRAAGADLMGWMEMARASRLKEDRFTRTALSTGQRKRLALIAALLENKPVLILDEWAADQDAGFRRKFYREVLPELKRRGLTVVAVTHDDRYFDAADRRLHLEEGTVTEPPASGEAVT